MLYIIIMKHVKLDISCSATIREKCIRNLFWILWRRQNKSYERDCGSVSSVQFRSAGWLGLDSHQIQRRSRLWRDVRRSTKPGSTSVFTDFGHGSRNIQNERRNAGFRLNPDSQVTARQIYPSTVSVSKQNYIHGVIRKLLSDWRCTLLTAAKPNTKFVSFVCIENGRKLQISRHY